MTQYTLDPTATVHITQVFDTSDSRIHFIKTDLSTGTAVVTDLGAAASAVYTGDIEIGAVELKDGATDTRGKVVAGSSAAVGDNAVVVADPNLLALLASPTRINSGTTAKATVADNTAATVLAANAATLHHLALINEGGVPGWFSLDSTNWERLPASGIILDGITLTNHIVEIKNTALGAYLSGIYGSAW